MKPDARQHTEFLKMLRHCEGTLVKVCLYFTDRSRDDFRDLYQEIACTLWEAWPTFRGESDLNTWVTRIALNVAGQEIRKRKRLPQFVELDESFYDTLAVRLPPPQHLIPCQRHQPRPLPVYVAVSPRPPPIQPIPPISPTKPIPPIKI